jgi:hypothetical protein
MFNDPAGSILEGGNSFDSFEVPGTLFTAFTNIEFGGAVSWSTSFTLHSASSTTLPAAIDY